MPWGEAIRLAEQLITDPSSHVAAAVSDLEHPVSREVVVLMDLFDLQHRSKTTRRPQPYPRPWAKRKRIGTARLTPAELQAVLARHRDEAKVVVTNG